MHLSKLEFLISRIAAIRDYGVQVPVAYVTNCTIFLFESRVSLYILAQCMRRINCAIDRLKLVRMS